jgi:hypothetical protein
MNVNVVNECLNSIVPTLRARYNLEQNKSVTLLRQPGDSPHIFVSYERDGKSFVDMLLLQFRAGGQPLCSSRVLRRAEMSARAAWIAQAPQVRNFSEATCPTGQSLLNLPNLFPTLEAMERIDQPIVQAGPIIYNEVLSLQRTALGTQRLVQTFIAGNNLCMERSRDLGELVSLGDRIVGQCDGTSDDGRYPCRIISQGPNTNAHPRAHSNFQRTPGAPRTFGGVPGRGADQPAIAPGR